MFTIMRLWGYHDPHYKKLDSKERPERLQSMLSEDLVAGVGLKGRWLTRKM